MRNELDNETSPYLISHATNPVHWQPWGEAALARARAEDKPLLLSVGYAACHWCHVMAHESFEDAATAEVMNRHFVPVKVDREERPDLDAIYQAALQMLGEHGGWPLTMFLTPDGTPFWGGTYFPPEARYGRPGFRALLTRVAEVYAHERSKVTQNAAAMRQALGRMADAAGGGPIPDDLPVKVALRLLAEFDQTHGGIGTAPKFPHVPVFELVLRAGLRSGDDAMKREVLHALRMMCQGGIYDHLGGGFARYSTDAMWLVPHFEKMLYDNAQLMALLTLAHGLAGDALFARRLEETAGWVLREMVADGGGFAATLDADSEGEEGRYYVWTESEIDRVLGPGPDTDFFKKLYGVSGAGNWEDKVILNRIGSPETLDAAAEHRLGRLRARLLAARNRRPRPGWDDKVLADWNGLMISALAHAGVAFGRRDWLAAARDAFDFVNTRLRVPGGDRLVHSYRAGRQGGAATLDDYAAMINAAITLFECFGDDSYLEVARAWIRVLDRHFRDPGNGGYFLTADDAHDLIVRARNALDGATPSGNGMCVAAFARLYALTGTAGDREAAEAVIAAFSGELERNIFPHATLMNAAELLARAAQVVIVGNPGAEDTEALRAAAFRAPQPNLVLQVLAPSATLPEGHPAAGKRQLGTAATAYVCVGATCSLPFTDPEDLHHALARA